MSSVSMPEAKPTPMNEIAFLHATLAPEVEAQIRADTTTSGLTPAQVDLIIQMVLQYGPSIWAAVAHLFNLTPKTS